MTTKYIDKLYVSEHVYHVYNRGDRKLLMFFDEMDKIYFIHFIKRYLGKDIIKKPNRTPYDNFYNDIKLLSFAIMDNHFHLMLKLVSDDYYAIPRFMKCLMNSYDRYMKDKYNLSGTNLQGVYKVKPTSDTSAEIPEATEVTELNSRNLSFYINANPHDYMYSQFTSLFHWKNFKPEDTSWLSWEMIQELRGISGYIRAFQNYIKTKKYNKIKKEYC